MTDARFPERWLIDRRFMRLSDPEFRAYITALAWSVANKTDGLLEEGDFSMVPRFSTENARQLERHGLWEQRAEGWFIVDFPSTQTSKLQLESAEAGRAVAREKKQNQRARKKAGGPQSSTSTAVAHVPCDVPRDITRPGLGQGQGQARSEVEDVSDEDSIFLQWSNAA